MSRRGKRGSSPTVREGFVPFTGERGAGAKPSLTVGLLPRSGAFPARLLATLAALCNLGVLCVSVVNASLSTGPPSMLVPQGPDLDYSTFKHSSQKHASLGCTACHQRASDNSIKPSFPGHPACFGCHVNQLVNPVAPMCAICHTDLSGSKPPLKGFPTKFKESFNVKFDHAQHMTGAARPKKGCNACHDRQLNRGAALAIPASLSAHTQCYSCHTPSSQSAAGRELASCGVCHDEKKFSRTSSNALAFRESFSHAKHGPRQRLDCLACHTLSAGLSQGKQVSSPRTSEHFAGGVGQSCLTCHNGKRSFGGDLAFKDCKRCHTGPTFRMP